MSKQNQKRRFLAQRIVTLLEKKSRRNPAEEASFDAASIFLAMNTGGLRLKTAWWEGFSWEELKEQVLEQIDGCGDVTIYDIKELCEVTLDVARHWLNRLVEESILGVTRSPNPNQSMYFRITR